MIDLTTLARLKAYGVGGSSSPRPDTDAVLQSMISSVSQRMATYCTRDFEIGTETEARVVTCDEIPAKRNPVASIQSVKWSPTGRRSDLQALDAADYQISASGNNIQFFGVPSGALVEVAYTGGLATDTADIIARFPLLEELCKLQVASLWQRHTMPDKSGVTVGPGETTWSGEYSLLKEVREGLDNSFNNRHRFL